MLASSVCVGYTDAHMNGDKVESIMDFIENLFWGFALTGFAFIFSGCVLQLFLKRIENFENSELSDYLDLDLCVKVVCSTLIIVSAFLLLNGAKFIRG